MTYAPSTGFRLITPDALAIACDVPTRRARRHLQARFPHRAQGDGQFALTECELMDARSSLRRFAPVYATGFTPQKKR
jgi:hypothetical protein